MTYRFFIIIMGLILCYPQAIYAQQPPMTSTVYLPLIIHEQAVTDETDLTLITHEQGFDTCAAPKVEDLAVWREHSPYRYLGIYLGGVNHYAACERYNQKYQTSAWLIEVARQGWHFIPIWVGPQAPCTAYVNTFPSDLFQAYQAGIQEARLAIAAAKKLGLIGTVDDKTIIYYDLEYYEPTGSCHDASKAFLVGWMTELKNNGQKSGIYSIARAVDDWYSLPVTPDSTWAAWYVEEHYVPTMTVETVNTRWIDARNWAKNRLFQYSGGHDELWGGVIMNIDNNAAAGLVANVPIPSEPLQELKLLTTQTGWLRREKQLFWTEDGGHHWQDIAPAPIEAVFFLNEHQGWAIEAHEGLTLWQTHDSGQHWVSQSIPAPRLAVAEIYLGWLDNQVGWVALKEATNVNASRGVLLKTSDGGITWQSWPLPLGEPVEFINSQVGWIRGGPLGTEQYLTLDGGRSWLARP